jgi:hypothetical protein
MNRFAILGGILLVTCICGLMISGIWPGSVTRNQVSASAPETPEAPVAPPSEKEQAKPDDLQTIFAKAAVAHGPDYLDTHEGIRVASKGWMIVLGYKCKMLTERTYKKPDKMRAAISASGNGIHVQILILCDGNKVQLLVDDVYQTIPNTKAVANVRQEVLIELSTLTDFQRPPYTLTNLGIVDLKTSEANGVRVSRPGWHDVSFYFDKKSHLLSKYESVVWDVEVKREVNMSRFVLEYVDRNGMRIPRRVREHRDGRLFGEAEITAYEPLDNIDDSLFTDP